MYLTSVSWLKNKYFWPMWKSWNSNPLHSVTNHNLPYHFGKHSHCFYNSQKKSIPLRSCVHGWFMLSCSPFIHIIARFYMFISFNLEYVLAMWFCMCHMDVMIQHVTNMFKLERIGSIILKNNSLIRWNSYKYIKY